MMVNINQSDSFYPNDNDNTSQKIIISNKYHSILPDLATGWRPKNAKIAAPIFVTYEDPLADVILKTTLANLSKLVYVGPRHDNSYKFHSLTQNCYNVRYGIKCEEVPSKLKRELEQFTIKSNSRKNIFSGMNPNLQKGLQFESNFESGNLDLVVKISEQQYNLFLRPDTNTRGHMQWFYFKVTNATYGHQKVRFNICNNKKEGVLYCRGMKPYVYSKHLQTIKGVKWQQIGQNIEYKRLSEKQDFCSYYSKIQEIDEKLTSRYFCLSFDYFFESRSDEVYFAYCPPFTYSEMKQYIQTIKKRASTDNKVCLTEETLCTSLTGLQIPLLTISEAETKEGLEKQIQKEKEKEKKVIVVSGRFHPGQSNGSYVLKGFIDYLLSNEAQSLRKKIVFKIIPIINPDGVVFGNYRTSLSGKDLNRKFKAKNGQLYPEISNFKNFVLKLKKQEKMKILYFLDFHGHSMKKNVFLYGPQYDIWSTKFEKSKVLPKMISAKTNMFRYQSCLFRVAAAKRTTARAFMLGIIPYCYTIESSVGLYRQFGEKEKQNKYFSIEKWQQMGRLIGIGLAETLSKIEKQSVNVLKKKKKIWQLQEVQNNKQVRSKDLRIKFSKDRNQILENSESKEKQNTFPNEKASFKAEEPKKKIILNLSDNETKKQPDFESKWTISYGNLAHQKQAESLKQGTEDQIPSRSSSASSFSKKQKQRQAEISRPVKNVKSLMLQLQIGISQINEVDQDSDRFSQGKSDCESDENDFDKQEYKRISGKIMKFIENFNLNIIGQRRKNFRTRSSKKNIYPGSKQKYFLGPRKVSNYDMTMVPSLKHRVLKRDLSEKKIGADEQSEIKTKKMSIYRMQEQKKRNFN